MKKSLLILSGCLIGLMLGSCIHEYPQELSGAEPQVNVTFELAVDTDLPLYGNFSRSTRTDADELRRRFIVDVYLDGKAVEEKRICTTEAIQTAEGVYTLPVSLKLDARPYTFVVWSDYVQRAPSEDLHFHTGQLNNITLNETYHSDYRQRETFCGSLAADLAAYTDAPITETLAKELQTRDTPETEIRLRIPLKRPQAQFKIVSTDVGDFLSKMLKKKGGKVSDSSKASATSTGYRIRVGYEYFFPTAYNVLGDLLCGSSAGIGFTTPCNIVADVNGECELASDFVFTGTEDSYVSLTLEVLDSTDAVVSRATGIQVPCRQGCLTVVSGKFLTTLMRPGIGIDTDYDGEFNIII